MDQDQVKTPVVMRTDRLYRMADFLEKELPPQAEKCLFDINYVGTSQMCKDAIERPVAEFKDYHCGSHGCVVGWTPKAFPEDAKYTIRHRSLEVVFPDWDGGDIPDFKDFGADFYGLTMYEAYFIFSPGEYFVEQRATPADRTDQVEAIRRLRCVANLYLQTGRHMTWPEVDPLAHESKARERSLYYDKIEARQAETDRLELLEEEANEADAAHQSELD